jgi:hypothetical protein
MASFFYVVSIAYHTSVLVLRKKKSLLAESAATHAPPAFVGPERLASHRLFERSKDMKVTGGEAGEYGGCGRHSKDRSWIVAIVERAVWDRALSCCNNTSVLRSQRRLDLIAGYR